MELQDINRRAERVLENLERIYTDVTIGSELRSIVATEATITSLTTAINMVVKEGKGIVDYIITYVKGRADAKLQEYITQFSNRAKELSSRATYYNYPGAGAGADLLADIDAVIRACKNDLTEAVQLEEDCFNMAENVGIYNTIMKIHQFNKAILGIVRLKPAPAGQAPLIDTPPYSILALRINTTDNFPNIITSADFNALVEHMTNNENPSAMLCITEMNNNAVFTAQERQKINEYQGEDVNGLIRMIPDAFTKKKINEAYQMKTSRNIV